jgi:hypothetical protein
MHLYWSINISGIGDNHDCRITLMQNLSDDVNLSLELKDPTRKVIEWREFLRSQRGVINGNYPLIEVGEKILHSSSSSQVLQGARTYSLAYPCKNFLRFPHHLKSS